MAPIRNLLRKFTKQRKRKEEAAPSPDKPPQTSESPSAEEAVLVSNNALFPDSHERASASSIADAEADSLQKKDRMNRLLKAAQKNFFDASSARMESAPGAMPPQSATKAMPNGREETRVMPWEGVGTQVLPDLRVETQILEDARIQTQIMQGAPPETPAHTQIMQEVPEHTQMRQNVPAPAPTPTPTPIVPDVPVLTQTAQDMPSDTEINVPPPPVALPFVEVEVAMPIPVPDVDPPTLIEAPKKPSLIAPKPKPRSMETFQRSLIREQMEEVSFLLSQCTRDPSDPERRWPDAAFAEIRLFKHAEAATASGGFAFHVALDELDTDDPSLLKGAVFTLIAADGEKAMPHVCRRLSDAPEPLIPSVTAAVKWSPYPPITADLLPLFRHERPEIRAAAMTVAAFRGDLKDTQVWDTVSREPEPSLISILIDELSKLSLPMQESVWKRLFAAEDAASRQAAVLSMLKAGQTEALRLLERDLKDSTSPEPWVFEYFGACGGKYGFELLEKWCAEETIRPFALRGLGRLGNVHAVETLLHTLLIEDEKARVASKAALHQITGATPAGADEWKAWWKANGDAFSKGVFYRYGEPFHLGLSVDEMADENTAAQDRSAAHLEMQVRSGRRSFFNVAWPVEKQRRSIDSLRALICENAHAFTPGEWFFGGAGNV